MNPMMLYGLMDTSQGLPGLGGGPMMPQQSPGMDLSGIFPGWEDMNDADREQLLKGLLKGTQTGNSIKQMGMQNAMNMANMYNKDMMGYAQAAPMQSLMGMAMNGLGEGVHRRGPTPVQLPGLMGG